MRALNWSDILDRPIRPSGGRPGPGAIASDHHLGPPGGFDVQQDGTPAWHQCESSLYIMICKARGVASTALRIDASALHHLLLACCLGGRQNEDLLEAGESRCSKEQGPDAHSLKSSSFAATAYWILSVYSRTKQTTRSSPVSSLHSPAWSTEKTSVIDGRAGLLQCCETQGRIGAQSL